MALLSHQYFRYGALGLFGVMLLSFIVFGVSFFDAYAQTGADVDARRAALEKELAELGKEITTQRALLNGKQRESVSLERDIAILEAQIQKAKLEIRARDIEITSLGKEIVKKVDTINALDAKLARQKNSLSEMLQKTRELDEASLVLLTFANESISDFFQDLDDFEVLQGELQKSFNEIRETREYTAQEKEALETRQGEEATLRQAQVREKGKIETNEKEKQGLLKVTKGEEARYQKILKDREKTAAQIRAELFRLRGTAAIPFGEALEHANAASRKTGVRPAFILGVIAEESNLGENVGTGDWQSDMHPERDRPVFMKITEVLGFDPNAMPVSKKPWYGWGGAMGPAQFIPSTWACYGGFINTTTGKCGRNPDKTWVGPWEYVEGKDIIRNMVGKGSPSSPWDPKDAFMAAAILLKENGADARTYEAERLAALRYFAGWGNANKPAYAFYGDDVMGLAVKYQEQINILQGN